MDDARMPELSSPEWNAVRVALADASRCGCAASRPSRFVRLFRRLTGFEAPRPLANPRLEALRAFVCASRAHRAAVPDALVAHGFNPRQVAAIALLAA